MKKISGCVVAPRGFKAAGVSCGIKRAKGALDLGIILSDRPAAAAGMFTTNRVRAASVLFDRAHLRSGKARGIVVNSGNANACTGKQGARDTRRMAELAAKQAGLRASDGFLVASTGVIGHLLPMAKVESGIRAASACLGRSAAHADAVTRAIVTTDTFAKTSAVEVSVGGTPVRIGGIAKGAGMIAPNMATLLAFVTTDCRISPAMLRKALRAAVDESFNCITVDGDMSTNDTILLLANGAAGNDPVRASGRAYEEFCRGLLAVTQELAQAVARDGEGATRFVEVLATGARSRADAGRVAMAIANSLLVKTAIHGGDPNWGRIICAAGYSGAPVDPQRMRLWVNGVSLFHKGTPARVLPEKLAACMKPKEIQIRIDLGQGSASRKVWTCDLSKEYISINADYHT